MKNVGDLELNLITQCIQFQNVLGKLEVGYNPPITFVFVQKRHQTRLFPRNPHDEIFQLINNGIQIIIPFQMQIGKGKNVPLGTVVDTAIVHPTKNDFFFVSHLGITVNFRCIIQRKLLCFVGRFRFIPRRVAETYVLPVLRSCTLH